MRVRLIVLAVLFGAVVVGVFALETPRILRSAMRNYLAEERVRKWRTELLYASAESGVDAYLLAAVMYRESSGRVDAKSSKGAVGLFQLRPITYNWRAEILGLDPPTEEQLLSDGLLNARLGADNLKWLLATYDGDVERALVAYNLGTRRLKEFCEEAGGWEEWRAAREAAGDSRLLAYARQVMAYRDDFRAKGALDPEEGEEGDDKDENEDSREDH